MTIKFLTLNLLQGGLLMDNILNFLDQQQPDIIALQEVHNGTNPNLPANYRSIQILSQHLSRYKSFFKAGFLRQAPEGNIDQGNAIFSKFPIKQKEAYFVNGEYDLQPNIPPNRDWSTNPQIMQWAEIEVGDNNLNIFNLHGIWGKDGDDNPARHRMGQIILDQIKGKSNVILAGDFNLRPTTQVIKNIEQHLTNVFKDELVTTFNLQRKGPSADSGYATSVVDMIFVSPNLKIISHSCPQVDISDHLPLVIELGIDNVVSSASQDQALLDQAEQDIQNHQYSEINTRKELLKHLHDL
ncbi:endonuclease/exonuclease/phosphatase family protein [Patescibacteria group bacterium]|nr:endonuclease/exonuclease/phosphatase family protein [Patescibacteria group bacterium]